MKKYKVKNASFSFISLLFITIIACNNGNSGHVNNSEKLMSDTLIIEGCQEKITMKIGVVVEIRLKAVPGSGYQWLLKDSLRFLQQIGSDSLKFSKPETEQPVVGQPGKQVLHFKAIRKGEEIIQLEYKRTWENEISNSCKIKFEIN